MRSYPRNSPAAAARIVALALIADGHLSRAEVEALDCCNAREQLGIAGKELHSVVHALCEDLLVSASADWAAACAIEPATMQALLDEIQDPLLRLKVIQLCIAAVAADGHLSEGESAVVQAALTRWGAALTPAAREAA